MRKILLTCFAVLLLLSVSATAQETQGSSSDFGYRGWGPRVGLTINPDQVHFGAHIDFGAIAPQLRFQPNIEAGFGDHITLIAFNLDLNYRFASRWDVWTPYLGGGLGMHYVDHDKVKVGNIEVDPGSSTDFGINLIGGIEKGLSNGNRFFIEGKLGLVDAPDFKVTVGWTFF